MNNNMKMALAAVALIAVTGTATWFIARNSQAAPKTDDKQAKTDGKIDGKTDGKKDDKDDKDTIKLVVPTAKSLVQYTSDNRLGPLMRILAEADLHTKSGKKIEVVRVPMTSAEMLDGLLHGTLKAHAIIPSDDVYLDLLDREWTLRTGKRMTAQRSVCAKQPYVIAVRRTKAEAMGWPNKEIGWKEIIEIARDGWKAVGKPEWGSLKFLLSNPHYSDTGAHAMVSLARGILRKEADMTAADVQSSVFIEAIKTLDDTIVWYPSSLDDLLRNEILTVPARCDMTYLAENHLVALNERSTRLKTHPDWVAIYPTYGTIVDGITAAVIQREWVTEEHAEAAAVVMKRILEPDCQKKLMSHGYRPAIAGVDLARPIAPETGMDPTRPKLKLEMPDVSVVLECMAAWDTNWKVRNTSPSVATGARPTQNLPVSMKKLSQLTPTIQCIRRAKPSTVTIRDGKRVGTGVVVDARGYLVTNSHVAGSAKILDVNFMETPDKVMKGTVVANDPDSDLAILRLDAGKYPAIQFADLPVSGVEVGESVVVIGNPLGYTGTVTVGIVSAVGRDIQLPSGATLKDVIQTDAGINPGNSGGPLLDIEGDLIGVVFAVRDGAQNIGFAIPTSRVRAFMKKSIPE